MAVKPSSDLLELEDSQLKCPVCLDLYTSPKILPCHHSFCQECLNGLPQSREARGDTYYISCPTCRQHTKVPRDGVEAFPVAFHVNKLKEAIQDLKKKAPNPQEVTCNNHKMPLEVFCELCETIICFRCAVRTHEGHKYDFVSDCYPKHYQMLYDNLKLVKGKKEALKKVLSDLAERDGGIRKRGESQRKLTGQLKIHMQSEQTKSIQTSLSFLERVEDSVEQSLKTGTHQHVLSSKKQMMERMSEVIKDSAETLKSLHHIGTASYTAALRHCKGKTFEVEVEKVVSFSLSIEALDSSLVSVPVTSLRCSLVPVGKGDEPIHTTVTTTSTHPGVYRIHCNPSTHGTHTVKVQVHDVQLEDTSLVIPFNPYLDSITPVRTLARLKLRIPRGVAVSDNGHVIVTEYRGHCVTILDNEGKKVKSFGGEGGRGSNIEFSYPCGVAITLDNFILVSDGNHRIQKISMDGRCVASVGEKGSGPLQFDSPDGIAISPITGHVYIADCYNHRIQVLSRDLTFSHSFGKEGSADGQFERPCDIAIDSQGLVYVTDFDNHRVQKFSPNGKFVAQFSSFSSDFRQLNKPSGITIDTAGTGLVYVSEQGSHCVSVFTSDGVLVSSFGREGSDIDQFVCPLGLSFDRKGFLYICDCSNYRIMIY